MCQISSQAVVVENAVHIHIEIQIQVQIGR